jgi:hypothetical protein
MLKHIDVLLARWAEAVESRGGAGGASIIAKMMANQGVVVRGSAGSVALIDPVADAIETAMEKIPEFFRNLIKIHYVTGLNKTTEKRAKVAGCKKTTYFDNMHTAHLLIQSELIAQKFLPSGIDAPESGGKVRPQ